MDVGLLWYDDDPKTGLVDKVLAAADRHREKYGSWPNQCYVHPAALDGLPEAAETHEVRRNGARVKVLTAPNILLHHIWIGEGVIADAAG